MIRDTEKTTDKRSKKETHKGKESESEWERRERENNVESQVARESFILRKMKHIDKDSWINPYKIKNQAKRETDRFIR